MKTRNLLGELSDQALAGFWAEAVGYARREIGRYARWRGQDEPVLAGGYDAEGVAQATFERLILREAAGVALGPGAEELRRELEALIKHRVRWLHERSETRLTVGEWDVLPPKPNGELASIFDHLPGRSKGPDEQLIELEKERGLGELKARFERALGGRRDLVRVFRCAWDGRKRREVARETGMGVNRVKALQAQVKRRLAACEDVRRTRRELGRVGGMRWRCIGRVSGIHGTKARESSVRRGRRGGFGMNSGRVRIPDLSEM